MFKKVISYIILAAFVLTSVVPPSFAQSVSILPAAGRMVDLSPAFAPAVLRGIKVDPQDPFKFVFVLDPGDSGLQGQALNDESTRLIRYFLASVTTPEKDLWVNLSPYEQTRIIPEDFGMTEMGRDLLSQDYILKQVTASLMYPDGELGSVFWKEVYARAYELYGTTDIPLDTFNKVWITPDKAEIYEDKGVAFIGESHLKVMLESDYMAASKSDAVTADDARPPEGTAEMTKEIIRNVMLPVIEKEVNEGRNFAQLRQVYQSLVLAVWYKKRLKDSALSQVYADRNKVAGIDIEDKKESEKIWAQYVEAFKKGAYNYIKDEIDEYTQEMIPRKYFSGGFDAAQMDKVVSFRPVERARVGALMQKGLMYLAVSMMALSTGILLEQADRDLTRSMQQKEHVLSVELGGLSLDSPVLQGLEEEKKLGDESFIFDKEVFTKDFKARIEKKNGDPVKFVAAFANQRKREFLNNRRDLTELLGKDAFPAEWVRQLALQTSNGLVDNIINLREDYGDTYSLDVVRAAGKRDPIAILRNAKNIKTAFPSFTFEEFASFAQQEAAAYFMLLPEIVAAFPEVSSGSLMEYTEPLVDGHATELFANASQVLSVRDGALSPMIKRLAKKHPDHFFRYLDEMAGVNKVNIFSAEEVQDIAKDNLLILFKNMDNITSVDARALLPLNDQMKEALKLLPRDAPIPDSMKESILKGVWRKYFQGTDSVSVRRNEHFAFQKASELKLLKSSFEQFFNDPGVKNGFTKDQLTEVGIYKEAFDLDIMSPWRFDDTLLKEIVSNRQAMRLEESQDIKKVVYIFMPRADHNGAFSDNKIFNDLLDKGFKMFVFEFSNLKELLKIQADIYSKLPPANVFIETHASKDGMNPGFTDSDYISVNNQTREALVGSEFAKIIAPQGKLFLVGCEMGGKAGKDSINVQQMWKDVVNAGGVSEVDIIAPIGKSTASEETLEFDRNGYLSGVQFGSAGTNKIKSNVVASVLGAIDGRGVAFDGFLERELQLREMVQDSVKTVDKAEYGGIDLDPARMNMSITGDGSAAINAGDPKVFEQLKNSTGFMPVILNISPASNLPQFFGVSS